MIKALFMAGLLLMAGTARADVVVFAAASLKEPLDALAAEIGGVVVSYGGSGSQARQISLGAPADVVILANSDWMGFLINEGHVHSKSVVDLASNRLVIVAPEGSPKLDLAATALSDALGDGRVAIGMTEAVPAGIYAKEALLATGLWDAVADRLAEADSVRSALALVARRQAPLGVVYATDARSSEAVEVVATFPLNSHSPIQYIGALVSDRPEAVEFLDIAAGERGQSAFATAGFLPPLDTKE